jgi:hypothetical protein
MLCLVIFISSVVYGERICYSLRLETWSVNSYKFDIPVTGAYAENVKQFIMIFFKMIFIGSLSLHQARAAIMFSKMKNCSDHVSD